MSENKEMKNDRAIHKHWYWVVYPETDADQNRYHCGGGLDLGLGESGIADAQKLARRFKRNTLKIKRIVASPELRTIQMADILHDEIKGKIFLTSEFRDQNLGELEGKPMEDQYVDSFGLVTDPPRGEKAEAFKARVKKGLEEALTENVETLVVVHPRVACVMLEIFGLPSESFKRNTMYSLDLPEDQGAARIRVV